MNLNLDLNPNLGAYTGLPHTDDTTNWDDRDLNVNTQIYIYIDTSKSLGRNGDTQFEMI